jgi:hypothetical protein
MVISFNFGGFGWLGLTVVQHQVTKEKKGDCSAAKNSIRKNGNAIKEKRLKS